MTKRNRIHYFCLILGTIAIGLLSRKLATILPVWIGDSLWAAMMYWIIGFLCPKKSSQIVAIISLAICFMVECSQLIQTDWLNAIRSHRIGKLVLGQGFLWSDLLAYTFGVGVVCRIEKMLFLKKTTQSS